MTTEIQRFILLFGLLAVTYLMVLAWNDDNASKPGAAEQQAANAAPMMNDGSSMADQAPGADLPRPSSGQQPVDGSTPALDVPDIINPAAVVAATPVVSQSHQLVQVTTDTLEVWIDTLGGDVVKVALPKFPVSLDAKDVPLVMLDRNPSHIYVAQSGLAGKDGIDGGAAGRARYTTSASSYEMRNSDEQLDVVLRHSNDNGLLVEKVFSFRRGDYAIGVEFRVRNLADSSRSLNLFAQLKRDGRSPPGEDNFTLGPQPYHGAAFTTSESRYEKVDFDDLDETPFRDTVSGGWAAILQHYFLGAWVPNQDQQNELYGRRRADGTYLVGFVGPAQQVAPGAETTLHAELYVGPKDQDRLNLLAENLSLTVDYGFLWWMAVPLFTALQFFHGLSGNWGVAIILLTLSVKLVLYPLSAASYRSMARMRKFAPQMKELQARHSGDRQKLSQEMMKMYQKEKINPLGGCLPILLQMPVFLALYWVLFESVELRQAPFMLWINDLAVMDPWLVLPILMGATMFIQMHLNPAPPDPMQAKIMKMMPIMFTVLFLFFPAGLVLYWLVNNVLSISQQWYITRQIEAKA